MKLSRSESLVMREILKSLDRGMSNKELAKALTKRLSPQGLANALKTLQAKGFIYRDIMATKISGAHASYRSTAASFEPMFLNNAAEFMLSKEATMIRPSIATAPSDTANCLFPAATLMSEAKEPFLALEDDEDFGRKLRDVTDRLASAWLDYRMRTYDAQSLKIVEEYEDALSTYLRLFECKLQRWAPGAAKEVPGGSYTFADPLDLVENSHSHSIDWPLKKHHMTEKELEQRHADTPNASDALGRLTVGEFRKLKGIAYNERKKRIYEEYLKALVPPKTLLLLDFGLSGASVGEHLKGQIETVKAFEEEVNIGEFKVGSVA